MTYEEIVGIAEAVAKRQRVMVEKLICILSILVSSFLGCRKCC